MNSNVRNIWKQVNSYLGSESVEALIGKSNYLKSIETSEGTLKLLKYLDFISFYTCFMEYKNFSQYCILDSTFKTNQEGLELFVLIFLYDGEGYPASYLFLGRKAPAGVRHKRITRW